MLHRFQHDILPLKDRLFRLALRITLNREDAQDIVQETLIKMWEQRQQWDAIENIEAYALTICRNLSLDHLKRLSNRHLPLDTPQVEPFDQTPSPLEQTIHHEHFDRVRQIIDRLPEKQRTCIQLRDFEGRSYHDIADILGITEEQVKVNIFRARQTIRKDFEV